MSQTPREKADLPSLMMYGYCIRIYRIVIIPVKFEFVPCSNTPRIDPAVFVGYSNYLLLKRKNFMERPNWFK